MPILGPFQAGQELIEVGQEGLVEPSLAPDLDRWQGGRAFRRPSSG